MMAVQSLGIAQHHFAAPLPEFECTGAALGEPTCALSNTLLSPGYEASPNRDTPSEENAYWIWRTQYEKKNAKRLFCNYFKLIKCQNDNILDIVG